MRAVACKGKIAILVWGILEKHIMLQKQLFNTFNKHLAFLNRYGFILHILLYHSNVRYRLNILNYVWFMLYKNHFLQKKVVKYISRSIGEESVKGM